MPGKKIDLSKDSGQKAILQLYMQRQGLLKRWYRCIKSSDFFRAAQPRYIKAHTDFIKGCCYDKSKKRA